MSTTKLEQNLNIQETSTGYPYVNVYELISTPAVEDWEFDLSQNFYTLFINQKLPLPRRLTDPQYGREELDGDLETLSAGAPTVEDVWKITERLPFDLSRLLSDDRDNNK
jgi:hypothetical protein